MLGRAVEAEDGDDVAVGGALAGFLEAEAGVALFEVGVAGAPVDADDFAAGDSGEALEDFLHGGAAVAFVLEILVDHEAVDPGAAVLGGVGADDQADHGVAVEDAEGDAVGEEFGFGQGEDVGGDVGDLFFGDAEGDALLPVLGGDFEQS